MNTPFTRAPHHQGAGSPILQSMHAALLIDFDNVTMGMRSDLSKDLKKLLQSDIIKGKVTVQRAYADWRRYPQYIVPLSEASIDLIFAPAYGSSKKNATDIRMAIDGMELVFTRPEIGTFILLTGDSDFSSLVLKLKEYGKYVIGVGIQESSSDILVQNCDEYYSYTSLTGLRKTTDEERSTNDPWALVEKAITRMAERDDVMRSDRLKQVMIELDPAFDEADFGYSKFSRFLTEAASKGLIKLTKLENGQHEVAPPGPGGDGRRARDSREDGRERKPRGRGRGARSEDSDGRGRRSGGRGERSPDREGSAPPPVIAAVSSTIPADTETPATESATPAAAAAEATPTAAPTGVVGGDRSENAPLQAAYQLLLKAVDVLRGQGRAAIRDSDVKRKMLEIDSAFDESALGFGKFTRFLRQAHDHDVVDLHKQESGSYEVTVKGGSRAQDTSLRGDDAAPAEPAMEAKPIEVASVPTEELQPTGLGLRRGSGKKPREGEGAAAAGPKTRSKAGAKSVAAELAAPETAQAPVVVEPSVVQAESLGLPTDAEEQIRYLTSYKGVGRKTAESLVAAFGAGLFGVLQREPERLAQVMPATRAEQVLVGWRADYDKRAANAAPVTRASSRPATRGDRKAQPVAAEAVAVDDSVSVAESAMADDSDATGDGDSETAGGKPSSKNGRRRSRRGGSRRGGRGRKS
jgi:uncharacterized protein (TIGR00288 family)